MEDLKDMTIGVYLCPYCGRWVKSGTLCPNIMQHWTDSISEELKGALEKLAEKAPTDFP